MIVTVTLNPALDKMMIINNFQVNQVCRVNETRIDPGGKGINISKVIKKLGGDTIATGILGGNTGNYIREQLNGMGIINDFVFASIETRTNIKIADPFNCSNTDINEPGMPVTESVLQNVWKKICNITNPGDTIVFAGKNPPQMRDHILGEWIGELKRNKVRVALDTVGKAMKIGVEAKPDIIKPNIMELEELCGEKLEDMDAIKEAAQELIVKGIEKVIVSMGSEGALFVKKDEIIYVPGIKVPVKSTVGAGDSMLASVLLDMERGVGWEESAAHAVAVSAANVMCSGTQAAELRDICSLLEQVKTQHII